MTTREQRKLGQDSEGMLGTRLLDPEEMTVTSLSGRSWEDS